MSARVIYREKSLFAQLTGLPCLPFIAESVAFGPISWIRVGPAFLKRSDDECKAILAHEQGHIAGWHGAIRLLWALAGLPLWAPEWVERRCLEQEFEADRYACNLGNHQALLSALISMRGVYADAFLDQRIARLQGEAIYE